MSVWLILGARREGGRHFWRHIPNLIIQKIFGFHYFVIHKVHLPDSFYDCHYDFHSPVHFATQQLHNFLLRGCSVVRNIKIPSREGTLEL